MSLILTVSVSDLTNVRFTDAEPKTNVGGAVIGALALTVWVERSLVPSVQVNTRPPAFRAEFRSESAVLITAPEISTAVTVTGAIIPATAVAGAEILYCLTVLRDATALIRVELASLVVELPSVAPT